MKKIILIFIIFFWLISVSKADYQKIIQLEDTQITIKQWHIFEYENLTNTWTLNLWILNIYKILWIKNNVLYYLTYDGNEYLIWYCLNRYINQKIYLTCRRTMYEEIIFNSSFSLEDYDLTYNEFWLIKSFKKKEILNDKDYLLFKKYWEKYYLNYETFSILLITIIIWFLCMLTLIKTFINSFKLWFFITSKKNIF